MAPLRHLVGRLRITVLGALLALSACQTLTGSAGLAQHRSEKVYEIDWWKRLGENVKLPYRPIEPASPEFDPGSGIVFVATADAKLRAIAPPGKQLWEYDAGGPFNAGPTLADGKLYAASSEGRLVALDPATGTKLWEYDTADEVITKPVVAEGLVLVVSASDTLFAIDAENGQWRWQYRREHTADLSIRGAARPLALDGNIYAGFADGYAVALSAADGALVWARSLASGTRFLDVDADPQTDELGHVFFASFTGGIYGLDATNGDPIWSVKENGITQLLVDPGTGQLFAGGSGKLLALSTDRGLVTWKLDIPERTVTGMALVNRLLMAATGAEPMLFVDAATGEGRRSFDPGRGITASPTPIGDGDALILSNRAVVYGMNVVARGGR